MDGASQKASLPPPSRARARIASAFDALDALDTKRTRSEAHPVPSRAPTGGNDGWSNMEQQQQGQPHELPPPYCGPPAPLSFPPYDPPPPPPPLPSPSSMQEHQQRPSHAFLDAAAAAAPATRNHHQRNQHHHQQHQHNRVRLPCVWFASSHGCSKGGSCQAIHDPAQVPRIDGRLPCPAHIFSTCSAGDSCPYSHHFSHIRQYASFVTDRAAAASTTTTTTTTNASPSAAPAAPSLMPAPPPTSASHPSHHHHHHHHPPQYRPPPREHELQRQQPPQAPSLSTVYDTHQGPFADHHGGGHHHRHHHRRHHRASRSASSSPPPSCSAPRSSTSSASSSSSVSSSASSISEDGKGYPEVRYSDLRAGTAEQVVLGRYIPLSRLGKGVYAVVVLAHDTQQRRMVAMKIFRSSEVYARAAKDEWNVLSLLDQQCGGHDFCFVAPLEFHPAAAAAAGGVGENVEGGGVPPFTHAILTFPVCGISLYDLLKSNARVWRRMARSLRKRMELTPTEELIAGASIRGLSLETVRAVLHQLLRFLSFAHSQGVIHTDMKLENILLSTSVPLMRFANGALVPPHTGVRVADLGNAVRVAAASGGGAAGGGYAPDRPDVQTRHYRAPEVVLDAPYSFPIDVWSVGVLVPELLTGAVLFATHDNLEHLALMERCIGPLGGVDRIPSLASGRRFRRYCDDRAETSVAVRWPPVRASARDIAHVREVTSVWEILDKCGGSSQLSDLVGRMLCFEPTARISAAEAVQHPFFTDIA